jgi:serine/threonine protein kinase
LRESQGSTNCSQRSYSLKKSAEMVERGKRWKMENFKIIRKLEEGSYSKVFLVFDKILHFICVLKVLNK